MDSVIHPSNKCVIRAGKKERLDISARKLDASDGEGGGGWRGGGVVRRKKITDTNNDS